MKLYEAYLISDKILIHNPDKLKSSKIFIVGLSGSGKTTIGKYLADKYNRKYTKLDEWFWEIAEKQTGKTFEELIRSREFDVEKVVAEMEIKLRSYRGNDIFDDVQTMWFNRNFILSNPVIMMGTSLLLSTYRAIIRDKYKEPWDENASLWEVIKDRYYNQKKFFEEVIKMRKDILDKNNFIQVNSKDEIKL